MTNEEMIETEGHDGQLEHHPHIGHALMHMAAELTETIEAQAIAIDQLRAADKEIERLKQIIANAPHDYQCSGHGLEKNCDCWKKEALT